MAENGGRNLGTCLGAAPSRDTLINIFKEFGPTGLVYGAVGPVALFLKDITTSKVDMAFKDVQNRAHGVANTLSMLMAASGILDAAIALYDNYSVRDEAQKTRGETYKLTTPGKIAALLGLAATGSEIYALKCSGTPGHELNTIGAAFAGGVVAKAAAVFERIDSKMVQEGKAPIKHRFGQFPAAEHKQSAAQPGYAPLAGDAGQLSVQVQEGAPLAASAPPSYTKTFGSSQP